MNPPPKFIGKAHVIRWAVIDERCRPTGNCGHVVGGELQGPAACLAICRYEGDAGYLLIYCDAIWREITDTWHATLDDALRQAEFEYEGVSQMWNEA